MKNTRRVIFIVVSFIANVIVFVGACIYLVKGIESVGVERIEVIKNEVDQMRSTVDGLVLYGDYYFLQEFDELDNLLYKNITYDEPSNTFSMDNLAAIAKKNGYGNLTGSGNIPQDGLSHKEMLMALDLNHFFSIYYERYTEITWIYYVSKSNFILLYPFTESENYHYSEALHTMEFYTRVLPENNPDHSMQWTSVYEDTAGQGYMVTLTGPIYNNDEFMGAVCADITLEVLDRMMESKYNCMLVDENNVIISSNLSKSIGVDGTMLSELTAVSEAEQEKINGLEDGEVRSFGLNYVFRSSVPGTPWAVVILVSIFRIYGIAALMTLPAVSISVLLFLSYREVENRKMTEEKLKRVVIMDELTGLHNRYFLDSVIEIELERADRYREPLSLVIFDLDRFKRVNDTYGHPIGDSVLKQTAELAGGLVRKADLLIRLGGEEFLILLPKTNISGAYDTAEKVRKALDERIHPVAGRCTASFGVAERNVDESFECVYRRVDEALYLAKESGRNRVVRYDEREYIPKPVLKIEWNDAWNSGNTIIDAQHYELSVISNRLFNMALENTSREKLITQIKDLLAHLKDHSTYEENILQKAGYPMLYEHKVQHEEMMTKAERMLEQFSNNEIKIFKLLPFIAHNMILLHTIEEDMKYFPYLNHRAK